jgi:hypothetical protein
MGNNGWREDLFIWIEAELVEILNGWKFVKEF